MINPNITLSMLETMLVGDISALPIKQLHRLSVEATEQACRIKMLREWLNGAISIKYLDQVTQKGKAFGSIRLEDNGYTVLCKIPKKVVWNQTELATIAQNIQRGGGNPTDYIEISYHVHERKYNAWPEHVRQPFDSARTLRAGKPAFTITPVSGGVL